MRGTTRVRILSQALTAPLTRAQAVLTCDIRLLRLAADAVAAGAPLSAAQATALRTMQEALDNMPAEPESPSSAHERAPLAISVAELAHAATVAQRRLVTSTVVNTLWTEDWTVTVAQCGDPDRYTGIEATRGTEHLIVAVGLQELITDQAGAHDCDATIDALAAGLRDTGCTVTVDHAPTGIGAGTLYALPGGPTRAHAVRASLRSEGSLLARRHAEPAQPALV